jgi:hypothetical protein
METAQLFEGFHNVVDEKDESCFWKTWSSGYW